MYRSPNCNDNYLEIRKKDRDGELIGVYCGKDLPENLQASEKFYVKFKTDGSSNSGGFLAEYKYLDNSDLTGPSGSIQSPNFPKYFTSSFRSTYRITVSQASVIQIEFPTFFMDEDDEDDCFAFVKIYNGYDDTAPLLQDETCSEQVKQITSDTNVVFIEFLNNHMSKTRFEITWKEVDKYRNLTGEVDNECGDRVILLTNETQIVNITSPGYPYGYGSALVCYWTVKSDIQSLHPIVEFKDVDLEEMTDCIGDYVSVSSDREDGSWKEREKLCTYDIRMRKTFEGTPSLRLEFKTDYGTNKTGFHAVTRLVCGGKMTESEGIIDYRVNNSYPVYQLRNDCNWNITVRSGRTIQFEFLELKIVNTTTICSSYVTIRNGIDGASPYLGDGQYCGKEIPKIPATSGNRAFVKYKSGIPMLNAFKLRYYEVQHDCGGQIRLTSRNNSIIITTPNYPNIPPSHIDCTWTVLAPIGERIRVDFIDRFDLSFSPTCADEYVELRDGSTRSARVIGTFCNEKPTTKKSNSNVLMMKFFTNIQEPKNGFKVNISIDICGGTSRASIGTLTSPNYPGVGAYPSKAQCDYRIVCPPLHIFNITILDIDLPEANETKCSETSDYISIFSIIPDFNETGEEILNEIGTFCGSQAPNVSFFSDTNEILVRFKTVDKTKNLFKGFKLLYNASKLSCGGDVDGESGMITSPGYPTKTLNKLFCEWKITVPKGKRVKVEFVDVDLLSSRNQFVQRIGIYNDFRYTNRMKFISDNAPTDPIYSSDNKMMITFWIRTPSSNRGFKLKYSSESSTICAGDLNNDSGRFTPPIDLNLTSFTCEYIRELVPIDDTFDRGTIGFYFVNTAVGKKISNCRYASSVINIKRRSGEGDDEIYLARLCGNLTSLTVLSPFPDITMEVRQNPLFGQVNYTMNYRNHKCGGLLQGGGTSFIRNPPSNAADYKVLDCAWYVKYQEGFSVSISWNILNLKLSCDDEYIKIYNGPTALSPSLGKFCRSDSSKEVLVSQRNKIFIEYHTEDFVGTSKNSIFEIKFESASFGCGGILTKNNFNFSSPKVGNDYPSNTECIWEIRADVGYHVGVVFYNGFFIELSENCTKDYVELFDFVNDEWKSLGRKCGRDVPQPFNSTAQKMKVVFHSDEQSNGEGFSALWNQNCGGTFEVTEDTQILASPGFPKAYGPLLTCNYTLVSSIPKSYININFLEFAVETTGTKCMYDNITIYKQPDYIYSYPTIPEKIGTYCGVANPGKFRGKDTLTIIFKSDRWVERKGFQLEYNIDSCGGVVKNSSMITSPNIVTSTSYLGPMYCSWNITAPVDKKIVIKFENFTMEHSDYCSFDYVEIFNGTKHDDKMRLAKICGNLTNTIKPIVIDNNEAIIRLKTDQTNNYIGFSAAIFFKPKCDQTVVLDEKSKTFNLDKTNQLFTESMECVYKVVGLPGSVIQISFPQMHLSICNPDRKLSNCSCNYVEVLDGNGPFSEVIGRFCGHDSVGDFVSTRSAVYVRFVTDTDRSSTGFEAKFTMIESPCGSFLANFTGNETSPQFVASPGQPNYLPNLRCMWIGKYDVLLVN